MSLSFPGTDCFRMRTFIFVPFHTASTSYFWTGAVVQVWWAPRDVENCVYCTTFTYSSIIVSLFMCVRYVSVTGSIQTDQIFVMWVGILHYFVMRLGYFWRNGMLNALFLFEIPHSLNTNSRSIWLYNDLIILYLHFHWIYDCADNIFCWFVISWMNNSALFPPKSSKISVFRDSLWLGYCSPYMQHDLQYLQQIFTKRTIQVPYSSRIEWLDVLLPLSAFSVPFQVELFNLIIKFFLGLRTLKGIYLRFYSLKNISLKFVLYVSSNVTSAISKTSSLILFNAAFNLQMDSVTV